MSWLSSYGYPVPVVLSQLSCPRCPAFLPLVIMSSRSCPGVPVQAFISGRPHQTNLSWLLCQVDLTRPTCPGCAVLHFLSWLSCHSCLATFYLCWSSCPSYPLSQVPCLDCPAMVAMSWLSCPSCPVRFFLAILLHLPCHGCPGIVVLSQLSSLAGLSHLSCPGCLYQHSCPPPFVSPLSCPCFHVLGCSFYMSCPGCSVLDALS